MKKIAFVFALTVLLGVYAKADILANYPFTGSSRASTDTDANSSASLLTDGAGFTSTFDVVRGNPTPSIGVSSDLIDGTSNATAVTANDYVTFTITPGLSMSLTSLTLDAANYTNDTVFSAESFFLRSSVNSFASNIGSTQNILAGSNGVFAPFSFDLTGASFQNVSSAIEFRIYLQDSITDADRGILLDNVVLNGVAVPEPATYMLLGIGLLVGAQRLRRKNS